MNNENKVKSLPLNSLSPVALLYFTGEIETEAGTAPEYEYEVFNQASFERAQIPSSRISCNCCGHSLKYACIIEHTPTSELFYIGRDCFAKIESLKSWNSRIEDASVRANEKGACNSREKAFLATADLDTRAAYAWASNNRITSDIKAKVRQYGNISPAQVALLVKIHKEETIRRAEATGTAPTGRQTITGTVLSVKLNSTCDSGYGSKSWNHVAKVLIDLGNGAKVYGNAPSSLIDDSKGSANAFALVEKGQKVEFTATFEPSDRDNLFGFWKRPTKWSVIGGVEAKPVADLQGKISSGEVEATDADGVQTMSQQG